MKIKSFFALSTILFLVGCSPKKEKEPVKKNDKLIILHTNDTHGSIEGFKKVKAYRDILESKGYSTILVDAGDYSQGSPFVANYKGNDAIDLMNLCKYDVATIGNHEFDYGLDVLNNNLKDAKFKVVCSNVYRDNKLMLDDSTIITKDDVKIGFFGLLSSTTKAEANPMYVSSLDIKGGQALCNCAQNEVNKLKKNKCDLVISLAHLGLDEVAGADRSTEVMNHVNGIDFMIDAHSHTVYSEADVNIQQTGTALEYIGAIEIDTAKKEIVSHELISLADFNYSDPVVQVASEKYVEEVNEKFSEKIGTAEVKLNGDKSPGNRTMETNLGDFCCDALKWYVTEKNPSLLQGNKAENTVVLMNGGGLRAAIQTGDVLRSSIYAVHPFANTVSLIQVSGSQLLELLEVSYRMVNEPNGGFFQVNGVNVTIDTSKEYKESTNVYPNSNFARPDSIERTQINNINGYDFDANKTYTVVTNNYIAVGGNESYVLLEGSTNFDTGIDMYDVTCDFLIQKLNGVIGNQYEAPQGRITII